ncbi:MAG: hypothetical protein EOL98_08400 [Negativicutes bacterium]|nr:hypothetical protein [Negativicutes bacterium]
MKQLTLFEELVIKNNIWDAHTVGKNLYSKNLESKEMFMKYFDFLLMVAQYPIELETRKYFTSEAETALVFFSENTDIDMEKIDFIKKCRETLMDVSNDINNVELKIHSEQNEKALKENNQYIKELVDLKGKLFSTKQQEEFDRLLVDVNKIENLIKKDLLSDEQKELYDSLTRDYSELISKKMLELNQKSNAEYNNIAVRDFKYVYEEFKENETKYKNSQSQLFALVSKRLFSYDASKLFNESLIYYNHVYSYIFSKLDDDGKFNLTQISIDTEIMNR